jgi:hypothetical protein
MSGCSEKAKQPVIPPSAILTPPAHAEVAVAPVPSQPTYQVALFGATLKDAQRATLDKVLTKNGLSKQSSRTDKWSDVYDVNGKLKGASTLTVSYVSASKQFANAEYVFPSFMDTQLVARVISLVTQKYGNPTSMMGQIELGKVDAEWDVGNGMLVQVSRGWPETTVYLDYTNTDTNALMIAEQSATKSQAEAQSAKQQNDAF